MVNPREEKKTGGEVEEGAAEPIAGVQEQAEEAPAEVLERAIHC